jgi:GNAT superfamily N-acetyltransferase
MAAPRLRPLTAAGLAGIDDPCGHCGYPTRGRGRPSGNGQAECSDWVAEVTDLWGLCGVAAHRDGDIAGYLTFAPAELVPTLTLPGPGGHATEAVGPQTFCPDAAVVIAVEVCSQHRHQGIGRDLVRSALGHLNRRQIGLVEVPGVLGPKPFSYVDGGSRAAMIMLPVAFWQAVGFHIVRPHPVAPVLRLDLGSTSRRLPDFAAAWRRFADLVSQPGPAQPASFQPPEPTDRHLTSAS